MGDTPMKVKQLVKTSYFAFFTIVILLAVLLWDFPVVHAESVTSGNVIYDNDSNNMESIVKHYKLFVDDGVSLLNQEDSGFPFNEPNIDSDGMATSPFSALPNGLFIKQFVDDNYPSINFNNDSTFLICPKSFTLNSTQYNLNDFDYCLVLGLDYSWDRGYRVVLGTSSDSLQYWMGGAGLSGFRVSGYDDYIYLDFNTSGVLVNGGTQYLDGNSVWVSNSYYHPIIANDVIMSNYYYREPYNHGYISYLAMKDGSVDYDNPQARECVNINYLKLGDTEYEDGSGGTEENNLYMRTADWTFKIPKYCNSKGNIQLETPQVNNWGQGQIIFTGLLNDYQKANPDKLGFKYNFYVSLYLRFENDVNNDIGAVYKNFFLTYDDNSLSSFINNNFSRSFSVKDIFDHAVTKKSGQSVSDYLDELKTHPTWDILDTKWFIDCSAVMYQVSDDSHQSGEIKERYDFAYQTSKELENTITENKDPYIDDEGNIPNNDENDNSSEESSKNGQIILTNNDNDSNHQTVTINNGHDEIINTLYDKLVPADTDSNGGLTQRFLDITQSNRWFDLMATAMPYIPMEFWNTMYHLLVVCLGITGIAFLIWVVCHII